MVFCVGAVGETVPFDVPSDADVARAKVEHRGPSENFGIIVFICAEKAGVTVCVLDHFFLFFLCFLAFRYRRGRGRVRSDALDRRRDVREKKGSLLEAQRDVFEVDKLFWDRCDVLRVKLTLG